MATFPTSVGELKKIKAVSARKSHELKVSLKITSCRMWLGEVRLAVHGLSVTSACNSKKMGTIRYCHLVPRTFLNKICQLKWMPVWVSWLAPLPIHINNYDILNRKYSSIVYPSKGQSILIHPWHIDLQSTRPLLLLVFDSYLPTVRGEGVLSALFWKRRSEAQSVTTESKPICLQFWQRCWANQ